MATEPAPNAAAPSGADVSPASSTGAPAKGATSAPTPPRSVSEALAANRRDDGGRAAPEDPTPADAAQQGDDEGSTAGERPTEDGESSQDESGKGEKSVPLAAFKARLAREAESRRALQAENSAQSLQLSKAHAAIELLSAQLEQMQSAMEEGRPYDAREEQIRSYELADQARQRAEELQREHEERISQAETKAEQAEVKAQLKVEIEGALKAFPLVDRYELIAAAQKVDDDVPLEAVAKALHEKKLQLARSQLAPAPAAPPQTARRSSASPAAGFSNDAGGMAAWLTSRGR